MVPLITTGIVSDAVQYFLPSPFVQASLLGPQKLFCMLTCKEETLDSSKVELTWVEILA